jgi:hypothetical protein
LRIVIAEVRYDLLNSRDRMYYFVDLEKTASRMSPLANPRKYLVDFALLFEVEEERRLTSLCIPLLPPTFCVRYAT